jgi:hypothetical protein
MSSEEDPEPDAPFARPLILLSTFMRQCSTRYLSSPCPVTSRSNQPYSLFAEDGDICLARGSLAPTQLPEFDETVLITADGDDPDYPNLQQLTNELKETTAAASDLIVQSLQLEWGIRPDKLPFLLSCPVFDFKSESDFPDLATDILLFLAIETSLVVIPGQCITPEKVCVGADRSILRSKVAIYRIRKFFDGVLTGPEMDHLISFVMNKLRALIPDLTLRHVPCCVRCLNLYCATGSSSLAAPSIVADDKESNAWRSLNKMPIGMRKFAQNKRMRSGLLVVQDTSARACRQAFGVYLSDPFPPFRQHPPRG